MRRLLLVVLIVAPWALCAQGFQVEGSCSLPVKGRMSLIIFDSDSSYRILRSTTRGSVFSFAGSVKQPVLAELYSRELPQPLFFYLENSLISITMDGQQPASSPVQGSRTNSQFRYALEGCQGENKNDCYRQWMEAHPSSIFTPYILSELWTGDYTTLKGLYAQLQGEAKQTYHYHLLQQRLRNLVVEGEKMPDVMLPDSAGKKQHLDSLRSDSCYTLVVVGAKWCEQCLRIERQLQAAKWSVRSVVVHLEDDPKGWNAQYLQQLSVEHIPYLMLLDKDGKLVARDVRIWELGRMVNDERTNE